MVQFHLTRVSPELFAQLLAEQPIMPITGTPTIQAYPIIWCPELREKDPAGRWFWPDWPAPPMVTRTQSGELHAYIYV
jgi:hypothetical protein